MFWIDKALDDIAAIRTALIVRQVVADVVDQVASAAHRQQLAQAQADWTQHAERQACANQLLQALRVLRLDAEATQREQARAIASQLDEVGAASAAVVRRWQGPQDVATVRRRRTLMRSIRQASTARIQTPDRVVHLLVEFLSAPDRHLLNVVWPDRPAIARSIVRARFAESTDPIRAPIVPEERRLVCRIPVALRLLPNDIFETCRDKLAESCSELVEVHTGILTSLGEATFARDHMERRLFGDRQRLGQCRQQRDEVGGETLQCEADNKRLIERLLELENQIAALASSRQLKRMSSLTPSIEAVEQRRRTLSRLRELHRHDLAQSMATRKVLVRAIKADRK